MFIGVKWRPMPHAIDSQQKQSFLAGGGELGELIRSFDWAETPLGPIAEWPQSLKTAVGIMLRSRQPIWIGWGDELTYLYNDPYKAIIGGKHPWALGRAARRVWSEIWASIGPLLDTAMNGVEGTYVEEKLLIMERNGYPEETYYTFSYTPILGDDGQPKGIICANTEDTGRVVGERQLAQLHDLAAATVAARSWQEVAQNGIEALGRDSRDLTFVLLYVVDEDAERLRLAGSAGLAPDDELAPTYLGIDTIAPWPVSQALQSGDIRLVENLQPNLEERLPHGAWDRPSHSVAVLPLTKKGQAGRQGALIVGLNPYRLVDGRYRAFLGLLAGQISAAIGNADAYAEERKRSEALAALDHAKTTFFSNVSHEFRTPLTLMLGPLEEVLEKEQASAAVRIQVEAAHRNGSRLLRLVNSLLDFSRIEAGRIQARYVPTDLSRFSADIASSFRSAMEKAGLRLEIKCNLLPQPAYVDREMWEKILLNLLSNAFKFTLDGMVSVVVEASAEGRSAIVKVVDTGVGIPAAELPKLFERFHRVESQYGRSFEGSGIGLALVRELLMLHGGTIEVESETGVGTAFTITLPLGCGHLPAGQVSTGEGASKPMPHQAQDYIDEAMRWLPDRVAIDAETVATRLHNGDPAIAADSGRRRRILLADDNADMRDYGERLLGRRWEVHTAPDGVVALDMLRTASFDLVVSDVMMPRLDGFGLLLAIRADDRLRELPVILLSARAGEEARIEGLDSGADDYLIKPFSARELIARINTNLKLADTRRQAKIAVEQREEQLRQLNADLEDRVAFEVAERLKIEEALRQSQKMEAVGQLTGGVAHDFNNLLTVILGGLDTIRRSKPGDAARIARALDMATQGAQRATALTSRLLAFSRRQPLEPRPHDLNIVVRDMSEMLHRTLGENIELESVLSSRLWQVDIDRNQLENAIVNLAVNARDAMPNGGKLTIETANTELDESYVAYDAEVIPGQYVAISVTDTGHGMTKETVNRAFEPFFTTKQDGRGTGLGLSQVYGFAKQSRGHVTIYSEQGQGTTAKLYFPRYVGEVAAADPTIVPPPPTGSEGEVVLVVEDNDDVRAYSVMILSELGYQVLEAAEGASALAILRNTRRIDLLFTDVMLPGKSGRIIADEARALRPGLKVLFATGYSSNAIVHHGRLDPGVQLITKPFTLEQLAARVRDVLDS
jgi:signal transduction histidine kinase